MTTDKPGDPADKAADGAFGGVQSHRAGYGDDKLQRVIGWLRKRPDMTLASGEGALLLAEVDRMRGYYGEAVDEINTLRSDLAEAHAEIDRLRDAIERVRALHCDVDAGVQDPEPWYWCARCRDPQPCPTLRALDGAK